MGEPQLRYHDKRMSRVYGYKLLSSKSNRKKSPGPDYMSINISICFRNNFTNRYTNYFLQENESPAGQTRGFSTIVINYRAVCIYLLTFTPPQNLGAGGVLKNTCLIKFSSRHSLAPSVDIFGLSLLKLYRKKVTPQLHLRYDM